MVGNIALPAELNHISIFISPIPQDKHLNNAEFRIHSDTSKYLNRSFLPLMESFSGARHNFFVSWFSSRSFRILNEKWAENTNSIKMN